MRVRKLRVEVHGVHVPRYVNGKGRSVDGNFSHPDVNELDDHECLKYRRSSLA